MSDFFVRRVLLSTLVLLAVPAPAQAEWETLDRGDRGEPVKLVQQALTGVGIRTEVDGVYGARTFRNVRRYERKVRIAVDGRVSRGQARGMFKRAGLDPAAVDAAPAAPAGKAKPRAVVAPEAAAGSFPIAGKWKWGRGMGAGGGHQGVDVLAACGTPLMAPEGGRVVRVATQGNAGNYVIIRAPSGEDQVYMHLNEPAPVEKGAELAPGTTIGAVGRTGNASTCHLHFEIWTAPGWYEGGEPRDPKPDLERWAAS